MTMQKYEKYANKYLYFAKKFVILHQIIVFWAYEHCKNQRQDV